MFIRYLSPVVVEDCFVQSAPANEFIAAVMLNGWGVADGHSAWVRDCLFHGQLIITATNSDAVAVVEHNYLSGPGRSLACSGEFKQLAIRHNLLGGNVINADIAMELERLKTLEVRNNTSLSPYPPLFAKQAPGPAPKAGDWFTRLRERREKIDKTAAVAPPIKIPEPPPLDAAPMMLSLPSPARRLVSVPVTLSSADRARTLTGVTSLRARWRPCCPRQRRRT